ncbi:hypothetical protein EJ08DRAFT_682833 [Tothia fuscella]|uniref:BTB domain-containing protein n=1 Tax=Tothia fuscella TaxID=1048955 RepID=A0A9P4NI81_9PEZI|nr:hypothetical protein EJ08DRAFT_682833 [Tothia fuscella]
MTTTIAYSVRKPHRLYDYLRRWHEIKAHKTVLCSQSEFFDRALKADTFKEGREGYVTVEEDDPEILRDLLHYLYSLKYKYPIRIDPVSKESTEGEETETVTKIEVKADLDHGDISYHVKMYAAADFYAVDSLKVSAKEAFEFVLLKQWEGDSFGQALHMLYTTTPPEDRGLRDSAAKLCADKFEILKDKEDFKKAMSNTGELGLDISTMLLKKVNGYEDLLPQGYRITHWYCPTSPTYR